MVRDIHHPQTAGDPRASGDAATIALVVERFVRSGPFGGPVYVQVHLVHADGSGASTILAGARDIWFTRLAWSPDGSRVAFTRYEFFPGPGAAYGPGATYVMNADGTGEHLIHGCTDGGACPMDLAWSPDGTRLAFLIGQGLGIMNADGSEYRVVHTCRGHSCIWAESGPSWSPDSSQVVFAGMDQRDVGGLFIMGADGGEPRPITRCYSRLCYGGAREANPAWSPDGGLIAFSRERNVFMIRSDGTDLRQISSCPKTYGYNPCNADHPAWSSDAAKLAYVRDDGLHVSGRDGTGDRLVLPVPKSSHNEAVSYCCLTWRPVPGVQPLSWLPRPAPSQPVAGIPPSPPSNVGRIIAPGDWAQFHGTAAHTGLNPAERSITPTTAVGLRQAWRSSIGEESVLAQSPVVVGGQVFVGAFDGRLYAFDARGCGRATCRPEWSAATDGPIQDSPAVASGSVFVGSARGLYAFPASGCGRPVCGPRWIGRTGGPVGFSSPVVDGGLVFTGTADEDSRLYAFPASGCGRPICKPVWEAMVGTTGIYGGAAVSNGVVYVHGMDPYLYAFRASGCGASNCSPLWKGSTGTVSENPSTPAVANGRVYVGGGDCEEGNCGLWVFPAEGCGASVCQPSWVDATPEGILSSPAVANGVVFFTTGASKLYAFDARGCGSTRCVHSIWTAGSSDPGGVGSSPAVADGLVFLRSDGESTSIGQIYAYRASGCGMATCAPLWSQPGGGDSASSVAVSGGMLFVGSTDSIVMAYGFP